MASREVGETDALALLRPWSSRGAGEDDAESLSGSGADWAAFFLFGGRRGAV